MTRAAPAYRAVVLAAALVLAALVAKQLLDLLLAVLITVILSLPLSAAATWVNRRGLPRASGALAALIAAAGFTAAIGYALAPQFLTEAKQFASRLPGTVASVERYVGLKHVKPPSFSRELSSAVQGWIGHPNAVIGPLMQVGPSVLGIVALLVLIGLAAFLIAVNPEPLIETSLQLLPARHRALARDVMGRIRTAWLGWLTAVGIDMLVLGGLLFAGMTLIGLPFAFGFAVFSALMTVIPNYGSIISAIPPVLVGLAQSPVEGLLVLLVYVIVNQIEGNLILPLIMARTVDLHPAVVTIGLVVMEALFGLIGVLISIPLLSLTIILVQALWVEPHEAKPSLRP